MSDIALGRRLVGLGEAQRNIPVAPLAERVALFREQWRFGWRIDN